MGHFRLAVFLFLGNKHFVFEEKFTTVWSSFLLTVFFSSEIGTIAVYVTNYNDPFKRVHRGGA